MKNKKMPLAKPKDYCRFYSRIRVLPGRSGGRTGCHEWQGKVNFANYGIFKFGLKTFLAHRVAFYLYKRKDPRDLFVLHKCDNPKCVNPDHLFLGTSLDNIRDAIKKGRLKMPPHKVGSGVGTSILKEKEVLKIRKLWLSGDHSVTILAKKFKVANGTIYRIIKLNGWKHVGLENIP